MGTYYTQCRESRNLYVLFSTMGKLSTEPFGNAVGFYLHMSCFLVERGRSECAEDADRRAQFQIALTFAHMG